MLCWAFSAQDVDFGADEVLGFDDLSGAHQAFQGVVGDRLASGDTLGVESTCPRWVLELLAAGAGDPKLGSADGVLSELRLIKSDAEVALIAVSTRSSSSGPSASCSMCSSPAVPAWR